MLIVLFVSKACRSHNHHRHTIHVVLSLKRFNSMEDFQLFSGFSWFVFFGVKTLLAFLEGIICRLGHNSQVERWVTWFTSDHLSKINKIYRVAIARFGIEVRPAQNKSITENFNTERRPCKKRSKLCDFVGNSAIGLDLSTHQAHQSTIKPCCMQQKAFLSFSLSRFNL